MRLCQADLPRGARVFDPCPLGGTGATIAAADQNMIGLALGHTGGHHTYTNLTDQLHADTCVRVGVLQVENQLRQIFDGVDIMVRWRRDETHPRSWVSGLGNAALHLLPWQLTTLTRLGTLCHLDLQFQAVGEVLHGHAKTTCCRELPGKNLTKWRDEAEKT